MRNRLVMVQRGWSGWSRERLARIAFRLARGLWLALTVAGIAAFLSALPVLMDQLEQPDPATRAGLARMGIPFGVYLGVYLSLGILFVFGYVTVAGIIYVRKTDDWMALFVAFFLVAFGTSTPLNALPTGSPPVVVVFAGLLNNFGWIALNALFYLFPDWRLTPRWTWIPLAALLVFIGLSSLPNSSALSANRWPGWLTGAYYIASWGTAVYAQVYRYRRVSNATQRQQTKWVVYGLVMATLFSLSLSLPAMVAPDLTPPGSLYALVASGPVAGLAQLLIPLALGIAVLRYRLWDIDPIINRTLVYGVLTALIVGIYVLAVSALGLVFQERGNLLVSLSVTALVAVLFQPLRAQLQRGVNHLMYGERDDPYTVLSRLGQQLETTLAPDSVLPTIVATVAHSLRLPYVSATIPTVDGAAPLSATFPSGKRGAEAGMECLRLPLVYQQETVGELLLAPRASGETFTLEDRRLLGDLAHQIGIAAHAVRLSADLRRLSEDLQHSRETLVLAREEERRRLRRDLHDGLGPTLAALALSASTIADLASNDPVAAARLAREMQQEIRASIADIRRLVYELRPPALDELGLVGAIRERAAQVNQQALAEPSEGGTDGGLKVRVETPEQLSPLPAAVEVASYRIVLEALTNVMRHAQAKHCMIRLAIGADGWFVIEITDDGIGLPADLRAGVGLLSLRERAAELGGACDITSTPGKGTRVMARLPITH